MYANKLLILVGRKIKTTSARLENFKILFGCH